MDNSQLKSNTPGALEHLKTGEDLANWLGISWKMLRYFLYRRPPSLQYRTFEIKKKTGGQRLIHAPHDGLKRIQRALNDRLQEVYAPKPAAHGFVLDRSIATNAEKHARQRLVLNIDIKDFFPSINFGRVRGMFMAVPYKCSPKVATILAQVACFGNALPQGAPTSPVISNMICAKLDSHLQALAKKHFPADGAPLYSQGGL